MKKISVLIPCFNDWDNLKILLPKLYNLFNKLNIKHKIFIINDSSTIKFDKNKKKSNNTIYVIHLKKNIGSQRAILTGLLYLNKIKEFNNTIILDSDGEDNPDFITKILETIDKEKDRRIIKINRTFRSDGILFSALYELHLLLTFVLTFKYIRFGNFTLIPTYILKKIPNYKKDFWLAYSSSIIKYFNNIRTLYLKRDKRYKGSSKMNVKTLIFHSLRIISVFKYQAYTNILLIIFCVTYIFKDNLNNIFFYIFIMLSIFFTLLIFLTTKIVYKLDYKEALKNITKVENY